MLRAAWLQDLLDDMRLAFRQLRKAPGFAAVAIVTLALGIGATTVIFAAVHAVLLQRFAVADPSRLIVLNERNGDQMWNVSGGIFADWSAQTRSFAQLAAEEMHSFTLATPDSPTRVFGGRVTGGYFPEFGVAPIRGRVFGLDNDRPGHDKVVVLSEKLWRTTFGADRSLIGKSLLLDNDQYTVIGIMPASFDPAVNGEQLWVPAAFDAARLAQHDEHFLDVTARLKPGFTVAQAQADLAAVTARQHVTYPQQVYQSEVRPLISTIVGDYQRPLLLLQGAVILVLLVACGNVANLQLARGSARAQEMAVRAALGAGRGRIARQLLAENLALAFLAAVVALGLARAGIAVLVANAPAGIPRIEQAGIGWPVALFAVAAAAVSAVMSGLLPALRLSRRDLQSTLRAAGRQSGGSTRDWVRRGLIAGEVALSLPVLIGAGLLIRSALALRTVDPGFRMDHVTVARLIVPGDDAVASTAAIDQVVGDLSHRPGVVSASATSAAPLGPGGSSNGLIPDGAVPSPATIVQSQMRMVTAGYLATMQLHLQGGRWIDATDRSDAPSVVVLSRAAARRLFPGTTAVGKRIKCCEPNGVRTVIGVVADVRSRGPGEDVEPEFYVPIAQAPAAAWGWINHAFSIAVRTTTEDAALASNAIRSSAHSVLPAAPVYGITTMHDALRSTLAVERFDTTLLVGLGLVGMLLAAIGIYGVVSYFVTLRTQEIGIRLALGARSGRVLRWMAWQGILPIAAGLAIGLGLALLSTALLQSTLHGVTARDPLTFLAVTGVLLITGTVASVIPARRASRLDPMRSIR